jgi:hypothetical protein
MSCWLKAPLLEVRPGSLGQAGQSDLIKIWGKSTTSVALPELALPRNEREKQVKRL